MVYKNEELGLVVAEDREEKMWLRVKDNVSKLIENLEDDLILQKEVLKLADDRINKIKNSN